MLSAALLELLADGARRPRPALCDALGIGAAALTTELARLEAAGLRLVGTQTDSLGLAEPIEWIDPARIRAALGESFAGRIARLEHALVLESTNRHLLESEPPDRGRLNAAIAEYQHGGRGRRGRSWQMPPGAGLALSVGWRFDNAPELLAGLSLAVGAAARRALVAAAAVEVGLKWPNDLVVDGGKLGGILVELDRLADGDVHVVAGIGINVCVPPDYLAGVSDWDRGARDLAAAIGGARIDRSRLAAALIEALYELFAGYAERGFTAWRDEWQAAHVLEGLDVEIRSAAAAEVGTVRGVDLDGALLVEDAAGRSRRFLAGEVTVRARP